MGFPTLMSPPDRQHHSARYLRRRMWRPSIIIEKFLRTLIQARRQRVAARYLRGHGLEIGALHMPMRLPSGATVQYVDRLDYEALTEAYPECQGLTRPDIVDNGFRLESVSHSSYDFVVANHVLEHSPDPVGALTRWWQVLRANGVLLLTVPMGSQCFDRGRPITDLKHMLEDHEATLSGAPGRLSDRNFEHYVEWVRLSERSMAKLTPLPRSEDVVHRAKQLAEESAEIHFHTFSFSSLVGLLTEFCRRPATPATLLLVKQLRKELVAVIQKRTPATDLAPEERTPR